MSELLTALFMGLLQGITEFLPVSSSGHLVIAGGLLNIKEPGVLWAVFLHLATAAATIIAFRKEVFKLARGFIRGMVKYLGTFDFRLALESDPWFRTSLLLLLAGAPVCIVGLLLEKRIDGFFDRPLLAGIALLFTGFIVWTTRFSSKISNAGEVKAKGALEMGIAQVVALVPGISRSGTTITCGIMRGIDAHEAARFSFLMAILPLIGAGALKFFRMYDSGGNPGEHGINISLLVATAAAGISGYLAIMFLLRIIRKGKLHYFAWYCWAAGLATIIWQLSK